MKITTIQLYEETKKKLNSKKEYPKESYDSVIKRMIEKESLPSMDEMFKIGDKINQKELYTTKKIIELTHQLRGKR